MLVRAEKPITKEQYERAQLNHGYIDQDDMSAIFSDSELLGYGIYEAVAYKKHNEETDTDTYWVGYSTGTCCD